MTTPTLEPNAEVLPGYRLVVRLGRGGFGEVWKATGPGGVPVALKFLHGDGVGAEIEARALEFMKFVRHPQLLTIFGIWSIADMLIIGMELADRTLLHRLREAKAQGHLGIPFSELLEYMREAAKGIDFLNEPKHTIDGNSSSRIIHRDIKPQNMLLVGGGVKVADFGLARAMERSLATRNGGITPAYAPPEFFQGQATPYSDQYSLAISFCQLRTGRLPFQGDHMQIMAGHLTQPPDLTILPEREREIVGRALAKQPRDRWPNSRTFVNELSDSSSTQRHQTAPAPAPPVLINSIGMKVALIPGGRFLMGSPESEPERQSDEGPQHFVTITRPFYMGVYLVTQREYEMVMGNNPSGFLEISGGGPDHPVDSVTWYDAVEFCRKLSSRFEEREAGHSYYLPTEAEWEYACRAGTLTPFAFGTSLSSYQANFNGEKPYGEAPRGPFRQQTTRVGSFQPNAWGLYDMHGNVWEWCADYYEPGYYGQSPERDPLGPRCGTRRVLRGGTWGWNAAGGDSCRSARRGHEDPSESMALDGFRVIMIPVSGLNT